MYYIDGTRYDQVDGTGPIVPSVKEDRRGDGARYLVPSFLPGTWSRYGLKSNQAGDDEVSG